MRTRTSGQALVVALCFVAALLVVAGALISRAVSDRQAAERTRLTSEAFYLAEGCIEDAINSFATALANHTIAQDVFSTNATTTFATFPGAIPINTTITRIDTECGPIDCTITEGGMNVLTREYELVSTVAHPQNTSIIATVHQKISRRLIPTFQHAVFYQNDLELLPGQNMTLSGRIHANHDIYLDAESGKTLTITSDSLHSAGSIYNNRKDKSYQELAGEVSILVNGSSPADYENMANLDSQAADWITQAIDRWDGTVQSAVHGVTELTAPAVGSIAPGGYYALNANVIIINNQLYKGGTLLTEGVDYPAGTISSSTTFYNNREGQDVKMTEVDLAKLSGVGYSCQTSPLPAPPQPCPNNLPSNGLLYATRNDAGTNQPGVRLVNGGEIRRSGGLTVVSNDPVYIQGNYNTVNEQPAAVICDAINFLSGSWNDANDHTWSARNAVNTTYNAAFIAGVETTTPGSPGQYNGGLENYPRLHENWTGDTLTIKGSFVSLWESAIGNGNWVYGNPQYTAPTRAWSYNSAFNTVANLPPFTPWAVEIRRIGWWKE